MIYGVFKPYTVSRYTLLGVSAIVIIVQDDEALGGGSETDSFNADVYRKVFKDSLDFYSLRFSEWFLCFLADNASTNLRIDKLAIVPHCASHRLNLEVNTMIASHLDLKNTVGSVHETMNSGRSKLKNAAILRNVTELKPKVDNITRSSGKLEILRQFTRMHEYLVEISGDPDCKLIINSSSSLANKTLKYTRMLKEVQGVTKTL